MNKKYKELLFPILAGILVVIILVVIIVSAFGGSKKETPAAAAEAPDADPIVVYQTVVETKEVEVEKLVPVEVEKKITTAIMQEGLRDMGFLVTQEYLFKEVTTFESTKTVAWVFSANSKLVMGYEGVLSAGIDFTAINVSENASTGVITITIPKATIYACDLDLNSFEVYTEDTSMWNPITAEDYNGSLIELKARAQERAIERGILDMANSRAEELITGFVRGLLGENDSRTVKCVFK